MLATISVTSRSAMSWSTGDGSFNIVEDEHHSATVSPALSVCRDLTQRGKKRPLQYVVKNDTCHDNPVEEPLNVAEKKRGLTAEQIDFLETSFNKDVKLEPERKALIAKQLGIRPRQVAIWFQNRRARWKNKQLEQDHETLKASYEAVLKEKEIILKKQDATRKRNKALQAKVTHLMSVLRSPESSGISNVICEGSTKTWQAKEHLRRPELMSPTQSVVEQSEMQTAF